MSWHLALDLSVSLRYSPSQFTDPHPTAYTLSLLGCWLDITRMEQLIPLCSVQFSSVTQLCPTRLTPWTAARQASLSITNSQSLPKPMSIELVMPSNHLILCRPLLLLPSIFPSIRVFSNESALLHLAVKVLELQLQHQSFQ